MRKAMAQNPNMIRTLLGLSLTLIILLSYAVYGATQNPDYYIYSTESESTESSISLVDGHPLVVEDEEGQSTIWMWQFTTNSANLTWVNVTVKSVPSEGELKLLNPGGAFWSHPELGDAQSADFNCGDSHSEDGEVIWEAVDCQYGSTHSTVFSAETASIISLTHPDPARRGGGTVHAHSEYEAILKARDAVNHTHSSDLWQISLEIRGNHSEHNITVTASSVNENLMDIQQYRIDAATEMIWAFASLAGCFILLLVPALTIYFATEMRSRMEGERVANTLLDDEE